ncbi:MAG: acetyltransferase [Eudoraea sp.]|uniref:acetyltransferase n=1 Tax=Eudoraea sp. TaxID=1979955 RepID=UPI0032643461
MSTDNKVFQLLGFEQDWVCVLNDIIRYNYKKPLKIEVFPNIVMEIKAADRLQPISFEIKKMQDIKVTSPILFGVGGARNKYRIHKDFLPYVKNEEYSNLIAKSSIVSTSNILSKAVFIDHLCVLSAQTSVGFGVHIKRGSQIGHHNTIGDFTGINPGVVTSGNVKIGRGCEIGAGAIINNNVTVGDNTFIGMGSVVTKDIPANSIAYGSPCKVIRPNNLWKI